MSKKESRGHRSESAAGRYCVTCFSLC